jgi:thymidylate kinase
MRRIIAFDGFDCTGKTTLINELEACLKINGLNVYTFHLTGPSSYVFEKEDLNIFSDSAFAIMQWSKFEQLFETIRTILSVDNKAMIILDRTPFTENIWQEFFNRDNLKVKSASVQLLTNFCDAFADLLDTMLFVNLNIKITELVNRIYNREADRNNYLAAFEGYDGGELNFESDKEKIAAVVDMLDIDYFAPLYCDLSENYNVKFINVENNTPENTMRKLKFIVNNLV